MSENSTKEEKLINTDFWGAGIMFVFAAFFQSQMDPDFTHFAAYFPERLIPCLVILGLALLIKGFVKPKRMVSFLATINSTMLFTMIVGLVWVFSLEWIGFVMASFTAIFVLLARFNPASLKQPKTLLLYAAIAAGEVAVMHVGFVKLLYVSLPEGRFWM